MFGEFNEATQLKTPLANYSIEFNDLAVQMRPHRIAYLGLLGRPYTLLYVRRSVGRLGFVTFLKKPIKWEKISRMIDPSEYFGLNKLAGSQKDKKWKKQLKELLTMVVSKTQTRPVTIIDVYIDTPPTENIIENILEEKKEKSFVNFRQRFYRTWDRLYTS